MDHYEPKIPISENFDAQEIENCLLYVSSTSPGPDEIKVEILRACWDTIIDAVILLYELCISLGVHPKSFQRSDIIIPPKPNKRDLSSPKLWRPIALLSFLGKGLERLIAKRISHAAIINYVMSS